MTSFFRLTPHTTALLVMAFVYLATFHSLIVSQTLAFGDAPYFYQDYLKELVDWPSAWGQRHENFGGLEAARLWIYPYLLMIGLLGTLGVDSDWALRVVFYFPATLSALVGSWLISGLFFHKSLPRLAVSLLYTFNSYFLLLVDGGQLGVALAYGLFPVVVLCQLLAIRFSSFGYFLKATIVLALIISADLRIGLLAAVTVALLLTSGLYHVDLSLKHILWRVCKLYALWGTMLLFLNSYWILPLIFSGGGVPIQDIASTEQVVASNFTKLINSLVLFQPHWYDNEFGVVGPVGWLFALLPLAGFAGLFTFHRPTALIALLTLAFMFLAKGAQEPAAGVFIWMFEHLPGFTVFRDSTKFFVPLVFFYSLLIGLSASRLEQVSKKFHWLAVAVVVCYILVVILPVALGRLSGNLKIHSLTTEYKQLAPYFQNDRAFFRSLWFPKKPSFGYESDNHPAVYANTLYLQRPFTIMIDGVYDKFFFLHDPLAGKFFDLTGIKYVFFPKDPHKKTYAEQAEREREQFLSFVDRLRLGRRLPFDSFPAYQTERVTPHFTISEKAVAVFGGDDFYFLLDRIPDFRLANLPIIFLEDGKFDPGQLFAVAPASLDLVFYDKNPQELWSVFFPRDKLLGFSDLQASQWAKRSTNQLLEWRWDALRHGIRSYDFDFGKGVVWSDRAGEEVSWDSQVSAEDEYYLAIRHLDTSSGALNIGIDDQSFTLASSSKPGRFIWSIFGPARLKQGKHKIVATNGGGFQAINVVAVLTERQLTAFQQLASKLQQRFAPVTANEMSDPTQLIKGLKVKDFIALKSDGQSATSYQVTMPQGSAPGWLLFTDKYHPGWMIPASSAPQSWPMYSFINGFYVDQLKQSQLVVEFAPQRKVVIGGGISVITILILVSIGLFKKLANTNIFKLKHLPLPTFSKIGQLLTSSTIRYSLVTLSGTMVSGFLGLAFYAAVARFLGPSAFGVIALIVALIAVVGDVASVGSDTGLMRFIGKYRQTDQQTALRFMKLALELKVAVFIVVGFLGWLAAEPLAAIFQQQKLVTAFQLAIFGVLAALLFSFISHSLQAWQKFWWWSFFYISVNSFRLLVVAVLFFIGLLTIETTIAAYVAAPLLGFLLGMVLLPRFLRVSGETVVAKEFFRYNLWVALMVVFSAIGSRLDILLIGQLTSLENLGFYAAAAQLTILLPQLTFALASVVAPRFAGFSTSKEAYDYLRKLQFLVVGLVACGVFLLPVAMLLIPVIFGPTYLVSVAPFAILYLAQLVFLLAVPINQIVLYYFGQPKLFTLASLTHVCLMLTLGWWLIVKFGILGAALAVFFGNLVNFVIPALWLIIAKAKNHDFSRG